MFLEALLLITVASGEVLYVSYGGDWSCQWPTEWRNMSMPYCFTAYETSLSVSADRASIVWKGYARPFRRCNSQVDMTTSAPFDACSNVSVDPPFFGYYKAHLNANESNVMRQNYSKPPTDSVTVLYYATNACYGPPTKKDVVQLHQCHPDKIYSAFSFEYFRKNNTGGDVLVAEYWDSASSCNGVNRGWAYLANGQCSQINFESAYRSWIAFW